MASVSSLGVGSNLDLNSLLASIKTGEQAPLIALQRQQTSYTAKLSAYGQLNSALSAMQAAAAALTLPALYQGVKASSSATDVVTASALSTATSGSYALNVTQLSQAQSLAAAGVASTDKFAAAVAGVPQVKVKLNFEFGSVSTATPPFTPDGTRNASIDIADGSTLADIAKAINANTTLGATASIINNGDPTKPNQLVLTSKQTGEASIMRISVSNDTDPALSNLLTYDPVVAADTLKMHQTAAALNTKLKVNGIDITSATNTVAGAIQDVTMTVAKIGISTLSVQQDTGSVQGAVTTFVNAYNSLQSIATKLTAFDDKNKSGAVLLGDSTLRNIQARIRSALTTAQPTDSGLAMLSQIGITFEKNGTLAIDSTAVKLTNPIKLADALSSNMSGVAKLFAGTAGVGGYGTQMSSLITSMTNTTGTLTAATKGLNTTLDTLGKQYTATSARIDATVARYKAQFSQLDTLMSGMNRTSSYLTQQFDALNSKN